MKTIKLLGGTLASVFLLLFLTTVAGATILPPGGLVFPLGVGIEPDSLIATAYSTYSTPTIRGSASEGVYRDAGTGSLDFVYQFTQTNVNANVTTFNASNYDNKQEWLTDIYTSSVTPTDNPTCASLGITGAALATCLTNGGHLFSVPAGINITPFAAQRGGNGPLAPAPAGGQTVASTLFAGGGEQGESAVLIIKTNAPDYTGGKLALIGTGSAVADSTGLSFGTIFNTGKISGAFLAPAVPEPGFYGVLAIGLAIFFLVNYRRSKQTA